MWWAFFIHSGTCHYTAQLLSPSHNATCFLLNLWICLPQQILNCTLDDIEIFVSRLQKAAEAFSQLNHRNKSKKNKKKGPAGLSPFLLMWWNKCSDNMVILLTLSMFVSFCVLWPGTLLQWCMCGSRGQFGFVLSNTELITQSSLLMWYYYLVTSSECWSGVFL